MYGGGRGRVRHSSSGDLKDLRALGGGGEGALAGAPAGAPVTAVRQGCVTGLSENAT